MTLAATTLWCVQNGGDDANNGGGFDPGQTAGMFTDGAATVANTVAPVFTSASYNFVAGDVNHWLFIASGANWRPGWYKIVSVAANAATLEGTIGQSVYSGGTTFPSPSTVVGCATVASPTNATWSIDYSQLTTPFQTYNDLASVGAGLLVSSAAKPFAKQQVGNTIRVTGGANFTVGDYVIASVAAGVATVVGAANITTGAGANGTGALGGCFATPGQAGAFFRPQNAIYLKYNATAFTTASATTNIATGVLTIAANGNASIPTRLIGYELIRGDKTGNLPTYKVGVNTSSLITASGNTYIENVILDGDRANRTAVRGIVSTSSSYNLRVRNTTIKNFNNNALYLKGVTTLQGVYITNCATQSVIVIDNSSVELNILDSVFYDNLITLIDNTLQSGTYLTLINSVFAKLSAGKYFFDRTAFLKIEGEITLTGDPFTNATGADFSLNNNVGAGAACRSAGYLGAYPGGVMTSYPDVGAIQHQTLGGFVYNLME